MNTSNSKVAIVTGASRGIGAAIASYLDTKDFQLVLTAKNNLDYLDKFKKAKKFKLDLSDESSIDTLVENTIKEFSQVDILINNAAIFEQIDFDQITSRSLDKFFEVDFKGPFLLSQKVFSQMKKQDRGNMINISSVAGIMGSSKAMHYAAFKSALISFTKSLSRLAGPYNININAIAPGYIETEMIAEILSDKRDKLESAIPLGRIGKPEDIAKLVAFLLKDESKYITGQTIIVDGGYSLI